MVNIGLWELSSELLVKWLPELSRDVQEYEGLIYGGTLIILTLIAPDGLVGMFEWLGERVKNLKNGSCDGKTLSVDKGMAPLESQYLAPLASSEARKLNCP